MTATAQATVKAKKVRALIDVKLVAEFRPGSAMDRHPNMRGERDRYFRVVGLEITDDNLVELEIENPDGDHGTMRVSVGQFASPWVATDESDIPAKDW